MTTSTSTPRTGPARPAAEATIPAASDSADRRRWLMLAVLITGQFMALLDVTIVNVAIPTIHAKLNASGAAIQLVVAGYTITYAMLLITGARLGDLRGHRNVFLAGLATFTIASLACGLAPNTGALVSARFVQGTGAALMVPQILSVIQRQFSGAARTRALGVYAATLASGAVVGQVIGGVLVSANLFGASWRPVFLVNVPVGLAAGLVALAAAMIGYGGFLFSFALHLQLGLGDSALRAGLTFAPGAAAFGAAGYWWRRLPSRIHHTLTPIGLAIGALSYLGLALDLRTGGRGGPWLFLLLVVYGVAFGAAFSPLVTQSLVRVPRSEAADASGLLTTHYPALPGDRRGRVRQPVPDPGRAPPPARLRDRVLHGQLVGRRPDRPGDRRRPAAGPHRPQRHACRYALDDRFQAGQRDRSGRRFRSTAPFHSATILGRGAMSSAPARGRSMRSIYPVVRDRMEPDTGERRCPRSNRPWSCTRDSVSRAPRRGRGPRWSTCCRSQRCSGCRPSVATGDRTSRRSRRSGSTGRCTSVPATPSRKPGTWSPIPVASSRPAPTSSGRGSTSWSRELPPA